MNWVVRFTWVLFAALAAGCALTFQDDPSKIITFADTVSEVDAVPPSWITPDGKAGGVYQGGSDSKALAFVFPSSFVNETRAPLHVSISNFLSGNSWFRGGTFVQWRAPEEEHGIEIRTARLGTAIVIDVDAASMSQILRLDWDRFRELQAAYVNWLFGQGNCWSDCFSPEAAGSMRVFWRNSVLKEASFAQFANRYLNPPTARTLNVKDTKMFATRIYPRQQLSITWGNQNFYPEYNDKGGTPALSTSYSRTTSGGTTRLQILTDHGRVRLYPERGCGIQDTPREKPSPISGATLPYPAEFQKLFPIWFMPVYNLFDLHNPYLLTAPGRTDDDPVSCRERTRRAPRYLFLLTPSYYVKPDNWKRITQFETEGGIGSPVDPAEQYLLLTRQFVILACDVSDTDALTDEWRRMLDAAAGNDRGRGRCGAYLHGVFSAKTFVELRNRFSLDGRAVEDGVVHFTTIGQAVSPSLGSRINAEAVPGSKPLLDLMRAAPERPDGPDPRRILVRFYTTMSDVLDQATVLEGDDIHAISVPEILR